MAIGDAALEAGFTPVDGASVQASDIDQEINRLADWTAERTNDVTPVSRGGTGADTASSARNNIGAAGKNNFNQQFAVAQIEAAGAGHIGIYYNVQAGRAAIRVQGVGSDIAIAHAGEVEAASARAGAAQATADGAQGSANSAQGTANEAHARASEAKQGRLWNDTYNRAVAGNRRTVSVQEDGTLGHTASSERYKKHIRPEDVTDEQVLMLSLVSYQWKAAVIDSDHREMGLIAERLVEAGLGWVAFWNADGTVEGLNYDRIGLVLLPAVQRLIARVSRLEDQIEGAS